MSSNIITFPRFALHDWKSCLFRDLFEELLLLLFSFPFYPSLFSLIFRHDALSFFLCWWKYNQSHFEFLTFSSHKQDRIRMASGNKFGYCKARHEAFVIFTIWIQNILLCRLWLVCSCIVTTILYHQCNISHRHYNISMQ